MSYSCPGGLSTSPLPSLARIPPRCLSCGSCTPLVQGPQKLGVSLGTALLGAHSTKLWLTPEQQSSLPASPAQTSLPASARGGRRWDGSRSSREQTWKHSSCEMPWGCTGCPSICSVLTLTFTTTSTRSSQKKPRNRAAGKPNAASYNANPPAAQSLGHAATPHSTSSTSAGGIKNSRLVWEQPAILSGQMEPTQCH